MFTVHFLQRFSWLTAPSPYTADDIYTYTGNVLLSVNPYKTIPLLYEIPPSGSKQVLEYPFFQNRISIVPKLPFILL